MPIAIIIYMALSLLLSLINGVMSFSLNLFQKKYIPYLLPLFFVSRDLIMEEFFNFPWAFSGYSQSKNIVFAQIADIGGVYLLSFIIILTGSFIYLGIKKKNKTYMICALILLVVPYIYGFIKLKRNYNKADKIKIGVIQPNINNNTKTNSFFLNTLLRKSKQLKEKGSDLIVWPEYTLYLNPLQQNWSKKIFLNFAKNQAPILNCFNDLQESGKVYNAAIYFNEKGKIEVYRKNILVPFGEYVPLSQALFFVKKLTKEISSFQSSNKINNLNVLGYKVATPICYEILYSRLLREFINKGANFIINPANDSWYGTSATPYQILEMSKFRSIENGCFNVRVTTSGISALIDPFGQIINKINLNTKGEEIFTVYPLQTRTLFTNIGYLYGHSILALFIIFMIISFFKSKKSNSY